MIGVFVVVALAVLILAARAIKIVRPWQKALIERLRKAELNFHSALYRPRRGNRSALASIPIPSRTKRDPARSVLS